MIRYKVLTSESPSALSAEVELHARDGWKPHGYLVLGPSTVSNNRNLYAQAVVKTEEEKK